MFYKYPPKTTIYQNININSHINIQLIFLLLILLLQLGNMENTMLSYTN